MLVKNCTLIKPLSCKKSAKALDAAKILRDNKQRRLIVVDEKDYPVGIISTTDMNNKVVAENKNPEKVKAEEIMTSPVYLICDVNDKIEDIFRKMHHHQTYFVPVTKDKKLYGILTYGELLRKAKEAV